MRIKKLAIGLQPYYTQIANFGYLSLLQVFNMALPLLTYPYLVRVLGSETYGMIIYSQAVVSYLVVLINFGFNSTATREISIHRQSPDKISEIVSSVYIIKGALFALSGLILCASIFLMDFTQEYRLVFILTLWMCLHEFLFPLWYFQGTEKMKYITFITLASRFSFLALVFLLVRSADDFLLVPVINGIGALISCGVALVVLKQNSVTFRWQSYVTIKHYVKTSYIMAISYGANIVKTNLNLIVAKHLFSFSEVIYVDIALKVTNIATTFLDMISQAVFPKMSVSKDQKLFGKVMLLAVTISVAMMISIQLFSSQIVIAIGGHLMEEAVLLTRIFALNLPVYIAGALLGRNCLLVYGYDKKILESMVYSAIIYVAILFLYTQISPHVNLVVFGFVYLTSFAFETCYRYWACKTNNLLR